MSPQEKTAHNEGYWRMSLISLFERVQKGEAPTPADETAYRQALYATQCRLDVLLHREPEPVHVGFPDDNVIDFPKIARDRNV